MSISSERPTLTSDSTTLTAVPQRTAGLAAVKSYGWVMVAVAAVAMVATLPGRTHGLGMITERLLADPALGLTRSGYGQINLWATLLGSLFCLGIGTGIDRFGVRITLTVVMAALSVVVLAMTQAETAATLFVGILLTRGFGQSALSVVSISIVGKWFDRNVSLPMAVYAVLMAGGFIAAALTARNYADMNWRDFWSALGFVVLGLTVLLAIFARDRSTSTQSPDTGDHTVSDSAQSFTHLQAMRTPMFWVCSFGISLYGMIVSGISLFNESILVDRGFAKEVYYESLAMGTAVGVAAKFLAGGLGLRVGVNRLLAASLVILASSLVWLTRLTTYSDVVVYVTMSGVAGGMLTVLFFTAWPHLFGRTHLGKIQGLVQMMTVIASAFGPLVFAETREATGSYQPLIWGLAVCVFIVAVIAWLTPIPQLTTSSLGES